MDLNFGIFKAYDIRGVYQKDFDESLAYNLGLAYATLRRRELNRQELRVVAACDMRLSSPTLKRYLMEGLADAGAQVIDIGLSATPTFYFAVAHYGYDGGIMVSASHNPKEYNGFKLVRDKALPIGQGSGMEEIKDLVLAGNLIKAEQPGSITMKHGVVADQVAYDLRHAQLEKIKPLTLVIDPANAMGSDYFEELFKHLPCRVIKMNWQLDGSFPAHEADPFKPENLAALGQRVGIEGADLGIATDGDGDRVFFVDEMGEPVPANITRAILCQLFLQDKPGSKIAYDVRPGKITEEVIKANGGAPIVTRVGHSLIKQKILAEGAYFAGESSGHFYLNMEEGCYEVPMIVTLKMLEALSVSGLAMSQLVKPYQKYWHSGELNIKVENTADKLQEIKTKYSDGQIKELDGVSVDYEDWWFNVRPSNTEPLLRLNLEAKTKELMEQKRDELLSLIRN